MTVHLVNSQKDRVKITSFGTIEFDSDGVSVEAVDIVVAEKLLEISPSLSIQGRQREGRKIEVPTVTQGQATGIAHYTQEQLESKLIQQGEALVETVSKVLGLDKEMVLRKMQEGIESPEMCVLVPVSEIDDTVLGLDTSFEEVLDPSKGEGEEKQEETSAESREDTQAQLMELTLDALRNTLIEAGISEDKWSHLKGATAKPALVEIILDEIYK